VEGKRLHAITGKKSSALRFRMRGWYGTSAGNVRRDIRRQEREEIVERAPFQKPVHEVLIFI